MEEVKVGDIMVRNVKTLPSDASVVTAAKFMREYNIGSILVTRGGRLKGILTERDIVYKVVAEGRDPMKTEVGKVMSAPLVVIEPQATLKEAALLMREKGIKKLPVVNQKRQLIGIITQSDLVKVYPAILDLLEEKAEIGWEGNIPSEE